MATRLNNIGPTQQAGVTGSNSLGASVGAGVSTAFQAPTGGNYAVGAVTAASGLSPTSSYGASPVGGDDNTPTTKNSQGGGSGLNASTNFMTGATHNASSTPSGGPRPPSPGTPPFCAVCTFKGWVNQLLGR